MGVATDLLFVLIVVGFVSVSAEDITKTKDGAKYCPAALIGTQCPDGSAFHYYECCGNLYNDCCLRLQTWVIVVLAIVGLCLIASIIAGCIRCICFGR